MADVSKANGSSLDSNRNAELERYTLRPTTVKLQIEEEHDIVDLVTELVKVCGVTFRRIFPGTNGKYHIAFNNKESMLKFINTGFEYKGKKRKVTLYDTKLKTISLKDVPWEATENEVRSILKGYGTVKSYEMSRFEDKRINWLETGEAIIEMQIDKPLPDFLQISGENVKVTYNGIIRVCKKCGKNEDMTHKCTMRIKSEKTAGQVEIDETENESFEAEVNEEESEKYKKSTKLNSKKRSRLEEEANGTNPVKERKCSVKKTALFSASLLPHHSPASEMENEGTKKDCYKNSSEKRAGNEKQKESKDQDEVSEYSSDSNYSETDNELN